MTKKTPKTKRSLFSFFGKKNKQATILPKEVELKVYMPLKGLIKKLDIPSGDVVALKLLVMKIKHHLEYYPLSVPVEPIISWHILTEYNPHFNEIKHEVEHLQNCKFTLEYLDALVDLINDFYEEYCIQLPKPM